MSVAPSLARRVGFTPPAHDPHERYIHWPGYEQEGWFEELFHVASPDARQSILATGLDLEQRLFEHVERPAGVYVWRALENAITWKDLCEGRMLLGPQDIWRIESGDLVVYPDPYLSYGFWGDDYAWYIPQEVPADRLTLLVPAANSATLGACC